MLKNIYNSERYNYQSLVAWINTRSHLGRTEKSRLTATHAAEEKTTPFKLLALIISLELIVIPTQIKAQNFDMGMAAAQRGDYAVALRQWRPLAEQGHAAAQFNLGLMYADRLGVAQSDREAVRWWRLASAQGYSPAQTSLAWMYANGWGVPQDLEIAYMWSTVAAGNGHQDAIQMRALVASYMTNVMISAAQSRARACTASADQSCE